MAHTTSGYYRDRLGFEPETENRRQYSQQHIAQTKTQYLSSSTAIATIYLSLSVPRRAHREHELTPPSHLWFRLQKRSFFTQCYADRNWDGFVKALG